MLNLVIPLMKHKEMFDEIADVIIKMIRKFVIDESFLNVNNIILPTLGKIEANGIYVNSETYLKYFFICFIIWIKVFHVFQHLINNHLMFSNKR